MSKNVFDAGRDFVAAYFAFDALKAARAEAIEAIETREGIDWKTAADTVSDAVEAQMIEWDDARGFNAACAAVTAAAREVARSVVSAARALGLDPADAEAIAEGERAWQAESYALKVARKIGVWPK